MNILVLYTRLTGYWMACMQHDSLKNGNQYLVIRKTPSAEAPFVIKEEKNIRVLDDDALNLQELYKLAADFNPNLVYVSGWADKRFLKLALYYKQHEIPVVTGMDNQWLGTFRQYVASLCSKVLVRKYFTHIWIPGNPQYFFARKLGFLPEQIRTGLYCADERIFNKIQQRQLNKQLIFVGRLVEHKGLKILLKVLNELINENQLNIEVQFIGNGPLASEIPIHKNIKHIPFVNPEELPAYLENAGYFILPSLYEAWGVVIHEAVLAGLPIITTNETGAASDFVIHNFNGYIYAANDAIKLKEIIKSLESIDTVKYLEMSKNSKAMASKINLNEWSATLNSVINL